MGDFIIQVTSYTTYIVVKHGHCAGVWTLYTTSGYLLGVFLVKQGGNL